jgi:hypothetical protein
VELLEDILYHHLIKCINIGIDYFEVIGAEYINPQDVKVTSDGKTACILI